MIVSSLTSFGAEISVRIV